MTNNNADAHDKSVLAQLQAKIAELEAKNRELVTAQGKPRELTFKVSEKGAISIYGFGKWPVTLYIEQMERLLSEETLTRLRKFMADNAKLFKHKGDAAPAPAATTPATA